MSEREESATTDLLARLGATVGLVVSYAPPFRWTMGPRSRWWEPLRRGASHLTGRFVDGRAVPREIAGGEYAGTLALPPEEAECLLWTVGFRRNPLARLKTRDGRPELGSWVYRASPLADRQLHLMLFPGPDGTTDIYAHEEPSSVNPVVGTDHFDGARQNVARGVERARERLPLEQRRETSDAPDGPWTLAE